MTGLFGVIGPDQAARTPSVPTTARLLRWRGDEDVERYNDERCQLCAVTGPWSTVPAIARTDGRTVAVWGHVFGRFDADEAYHPRPFGGRSTAKYVLEQYERGGLAALERLNGEYALSLVDQGRQTAAVLTDRVGSRPIYVTPSGDGVALFATDIQVLARSPAVTTTVDPGLLGEYLTLGRTFGTATPLSGIEQLPPASTRTFDLTTGATETSTYWRPTYAPADVPYDQFVERFADLLVTIMRERLAPDRRYGLSLSGGGDSRLVLAAALAAGRSVRTYHLNEWENDEAATAREVAATAGVAFRFLRRGRDHQPRSLVRNAPICQFSSNFSQGHWTLFDEELAGEDVLLTGKMVEELLDHHGGLPTRSLFVGLGTVEFPFTPDIESVAEFVAHTVSLSPSLYDGPSIATVLSARCRSHTDGRVTFHGVEYPSVDSLVAFNELYPLTNDADYFDYYSLVRLTDHWSPFLDARLLSFAQRYPLEYRLRRNIAYDAVEHLNPALAAIRTSNTGRPLSAPFSHHWVAYYLRRLQGKLPLPSRRPPEPHYTHGPWTDDAALIRMDGFIEETVAERTALVDAIPGLSLSGIERCLQEHRAGADHSQSLYALATLLRMPAIDAAVSGD